MLDVGSVKAICDICQNENEISLNCFLGSDYRFKDSVVAMCRSCNKDFIVMLNGPKRSLVCSHKP